MLYIIYITKNLIAKLNGRHGRKEEMGSVSSY